MASEDMVRVTPGTARCLAECDSASAHGIEDTPLPSGPPIGCAYFKIPLLTSGEGSGLLFKTSYQG